MTPATLVCRNLMRRRTRLGLTLLAIAVAFLLFGVMSAMRQNFSLGPSDANATRLVVSSRIGDFEPLPIAHVDRVRGVPGVAALSYRVYGIAHYRDPKAIFATLAVDPASYLALYPDYVLAPADRADFIRDRDAMIVGRTLADRFGWKKGDMVPIAQRIAIEGGGEIVRTMRIAGIFHGASADVGTGLALTSYAAWNARRPIGQDGISSIVVRTAAPTHNDGVAAAIDGTFRNSPHETRTLTEEAFARALIAQIGDISRITGLVIAAGFFAILLIVASAMAASIRERSREIGVLRLLGFPPVRIGRLLFAESLACAMIGGAIGLILAQAAIAILRGADAASFGRMALTGPAIAVAILLMLLFGLATAALRVRRALGMDITTLLARR